MTLETFFEKFDELADMPNGVKQLRELVMQLAVEGGLVPQSAAEPAVPYASVEETTPINVSDVPDNWRVVLLADAIKNRSGNSKLIKGKLYEEPADGRFQGFSASGADVWCDDYEHEGLAVIISAVGARCGKAFKASGKWCAIANTNITRPEPALFDFDFAYLVLNNEHFWVRGGSAQPFVKFPPSLDRHFALPPLAEQKRIVAKVDELMVLCDRLEAQQQERETRHAELARASLARFAGAPTPANLNFLFHPSFAIPPADLRKSIYQAAFDGALTSHSREADSPGEIPTGWVQRDIASLCIIEDGDRGSAYPDKTDFSESGHCVFLNTKNVRRHGFDFTKTEWISEQKHQQLRKGTLIRGDIVFTSRGTIGNVAHYDDSVPFNVMRINSGMFILRGFQKHMEASFLSRLLRSPQIRSQIDRLQSGSAQPQLPIREFRKFTSLIPPLAEQRRIVAKVEQLMALVDALETQLAASRATSANLLSALVAELTGTPNDSKVSVPSSSGTGRRGRPRKSA